jgi:DNA polymerase-3 subunit epsilon
MAKLFFYDLETTGVKFWKNGIHQISGAIVIDGEIKESFNMHVKPYPAAIIEQEALDIAGVTEEQIMAYADMTHVHQHLLQTLGKYVDKYNKMDKFHLVGYNNASFDNQFFRAFFTQCNDNYFGSWFWSDSLDLMVLASHKLMDERSAMENFQLKTVARKLGIDVDETKLHDAKYDIGLCIQMYDKLTEY